MQVMPVLLAQGAALAIQPGDIPDLIGKSARQKVVGKKC